MKRRARLCKAVLVGCLSLLPKSALYAQDFNIPNGTLAPPIVVNGGTTGTVQPGGTITSSVDGIVPLEIKSSGFTTNLNGTISSTGLATGGILLSGIGGSSAINIGATGLLSTTDFGIQSTGGANVTIVINGGKITSTSRSIYLNGGNHSIDITGGILSHDIDLIGNSNDKVTLTNATLSGNLFLNGGNDTVNITGSTVGKQISFSGGTSSLVVKNSTIWSGGTSIYASGGDQSITLDNATGGNEIVLMNGNHTVIVQNGSNFTGQLFGTGGNQKFSVLNSVFGGAIVSQGTSNSITLVNAGADRVLAQGAGTNAISIDSSTVKGNVFLQNGVGQTIVIKNSTIGSQVFIQGSGSNAITLTNSSINGQVFVQQGTDQSINITGGTVNGQIFAQGSGAQTIVVNNVGGSSGQVFAQSNTGNNSISVTNHPVTDQVFVQGTGSHNILVDNAGTLRQVFAQGTGNHTVSVRNTNVTDQVFANGNGAGSHNVNVENAGTAMRQILAQGTGPQTINVTNTTLSQLIEAQSGGAGGNTINAQNVTVPTIVSNGGTNPSSVNLKDSNITNQLAFNGSGGGTISLNNTKANQIEGSSGNDTITLNNGSSITNNLYANGGTDTINIVNGSKVGADVSNTGTIKVNVQNGSSVGGNIYGQGNADEVTLQNGSIVQKNIYLGDGNNKVIVDGSTVKGEIGVLTGDDTVTIRNGGVAEKNIDFGAAGNDTLNVVNGGTINGSSRGDNLNIVGGGVAYLNGPVDVSNKTTISGATANVIGTLTSNNGVDVLAGGVLAGNGIVNVSPFQDAEIAQNGLGNPPLVNVQSGGAIAPSGLGTLLVQGNVQSTNGNFYANLNNANSNLLNVTGTTAISGGTIYVTTAPGGSYLPGQSWKIISATGGVSGSYGGVQDDLAFVKFVQVLSPNQLNLMAQNDFAGPAQTFNQKAIGNYLDSIYAGTNGNLRNSLNTLLGLSASQGLHAFNLLSGEMHGSTMSISLEQSSLNMRNVMNFIRFSEQGGSSSSVMGGATTAMANPMSSSGIQQAAYEVSMDPERIWRDIYIMGPATRAWMVGFGTGGSAQGDGNAQGFNYALTGATFGVDRWLDPTTLVGVSTGYGYAYINGDNQAGTSNINSFQLSIYGRKDIGLAYLMGAVGYAYDGYNTNRDIVIGPLASRAHSIHGGNELQTYLESGLRYDVNGWRLIPMAAVQYLLAGQNSFTETGAGPLNLAVNSQSADTLRSIIGLHLGRLPTADRMISPFGYARWSHEYLNQDRIVTASFAASSPAGFGIRGANLGTDYLNTGIGAQVQFQNWLRSSLYYDFQVSNQSDAHTLAGQVELRW